MANLLLCTFFSVLCVITVCAQLPPKLPNIGYIGYGYNLYYGNPHSTSQFDPGFGQAPLFTFTYDQQQTTTDGKWLIPDNVGVPGTATECSVSGSSQTIQTAYDYQSSLSVDVTVSASGYGASFSASADYKKVTQDTSENTDVFITTSATCQTYLVDLNTFIHPNLSAIFIKQGSLLPEFFDPNNASAFWEFFNIIGTHFPTQIIFGSRWGYSFESTQEQYTTMQQAGIDITVAASYAGVIRAGVTTETSYAQQMATSFSTLTFNTFEYGLGTTPPASGDTQDWLTTSLSSEFMDPLQYTLSSIAELFSPNYSYDGLLVERYAAVSEALTQYCPLYLLPNGVVASCDAPEPSPPALPVGYAVLSCQGMGGGGYDCGDGSAAVYDGLNAIQAQEVVLDFCPECVIVTSITDAQCLALSVGQNNAWAEANGNTNLTFVIDQSMEGCYIFGGGSQCQPEAAGCAEPPPQGATWGAIGCSEGCQQYVTTSTGYPDRLEAHQVALELIKSGFIAIDFDQCGAVARGSNGIAGVASDTPQDAINGALELCQSSFDDCESLTFSCVPGNNLQRRTHGKKKSTNIKRFAKSK